MFEIQSPSAYFSSSSQKKEPLAALLGGGFQYKLSLGLQTSAWVSFEKWDAEEDLNLKFCQELDFGLMPQLKELYFIYRMSTTPNDYLAKKW